MSKELDELTWQKVIVILKDHGVHIVRVMYSGSGDSGGIDEVMYLDKESDLIENDTIDINHDHVMDLCYPLLEDIEDWYNNEGGDGSIHINLSNLKYEIVNNINIVSQETYNHKGSIKDVIKSTS